MNNRPTQTLILRSNKYHAFQKSHYPIALCACQENSMKYTKMLILIEELDHMHIKIRKKQLVLPCITFSKMSHHAKEILKITGITQNCWQLLQPEVEQRHVPEQKRQTFTSTGLSGNWSPYRIYLFLFHAMVFKTNFLLPTTRHKIAA